MDQTTAVPDTIEGVWADMQPFCTGCWGPCSNRATVMVRAEHHSCQRHDGRFFTKCSSCLDQYIEAGGTTKCQFLGTEHLRIVEVRDLPS